MSRSSEISVSTAERTFFLKNGDVVLRNVLSPEELSCLSDAMFRLAARADDAEHDADDFKYGKGHESGRDILRRTDFSIEGAVPIPDKAGDVIFHNIKLLHGSPASRNERMQLTARTRSPSSIVHRHHSIR